MKQYSILCLFVLFLNSAGVYASDTVPEQYAATIQEISEWINDQINKQKYVGMSIGFIEGDYMWAEGFGLADIERQVPMTTQSVHRLASISKSMTAAGVVLLVQAGKIDLDAEVQTYVPSFPRKKWPITVRQLLGHISGISHYKNFETESNHTKRFTTEEALAIFQDWDLLFEPGTGYRYTTYGYNLLGAVIEGATGQSYREYMTEIVWEPLGMTSTRTDDIQDIILNRVAGYTDQDGKFYNCRPVSTTMKYAGGGTVSTVGDMLRFARGLMNDETLEKHWLDSMWTRMATDSGYQTSYGMGWRISYDSRHYEVYHGGRQDGTRTFLWLIPSRKLAIAVLCNYNNADRFTPARLLFESLLERPFVLPGVYSTRPEDAVRITYLSKAVNAGCAYYDRYRQSLTSDTERIASGFHYLNESLKPKEKEAVENRIDKGLWPITDQTVLCATSFMADVLARQHGDDYLWQYHRAGIIQICNDYIEHYRSEQGFSQNLRFSTLIEELVKNAHRDWLATWTVEVENLDIENDYITAETETFLRKVFHGRNICPDLATPLSQRAWKELFANNINDALRIGNLAVNLFPQSSRSTIELGIINIADGKTEAGSKLIHMAHRDLPGGVNQSRLNTIAYEFAGSGQLEIAQKILGVAIELFPEIANLYDSKAEMHLMLGDTATAIKLYSKALQINPELQSSKNMLEKIKRSD